jgi:hypothetical protein
MHPDGHEDHLINIKGVDNSSIDPNGWRGWSAHNSHAIVNEDFDYMTALISATEELKPSLKPVTLSRLQPGPYSWSRDSRHTFGRSHFRLSIKPGIPLS